MSQYTVESIVNTAGYVLMLPEGQAEEFIVHGFKFRKSNLENTRPGYRYFVSKDSIEADNKNDAYAQFQEKLHTVCDGMAYFYSQPFNVEFWNVMISKEGDENAFVQVHELRPTTTMTDYNRISEDLEKLIDVLEEDEDFQNVAWMYNNLAKLDDVDSDVSIKQLEMCRLADALAEQKEIKPCDTCGRGGYRTVNRDDLKILLGDDLYKTLYGGSDILRHRLAHGALKGAKFMPGMMEDEYILKISKRIKDKFGPENVVTNDMDDKIRSTNTWRGCSAAVKREEGSLEHHIGLLRNKDVHNTGRIERGW